MAGIRKFFKKSGRKKGSSKEDLHSDAGSEYAFGYVIGKDKDFPKLHKAVWNRDTAKVKQLCKKFDINQFDKENRCVFSFVYTNVSTCFGVISVELWQHNVLRNDLYGHYLLFFEDNIVSRIFLFMSM